MASVKIPKIDPLNIEDPIYRGMFYKEIRQPENSWDRWEISVDETLKPELIAQRYYGTVNMKFLVAVAAGLDDLRGELQAGAEIALPPLVWVRQRIKHYSTISPPDKTIVTREDVTNSVSSAVESSLQQQARARQQAFKVPSATLPDLALMLEGRNG